jgi:hypothetical protein
MILSKQDQQEKAALNERNPHTTQQQEPAARAQADPKQKQDRAQDNSTDGLITKMINNSYLIRNSKTKNK